MKLYKAYKLKLRTQEELDDHRRGGHAQYSADCPECKRGVARQRPHMRRYTRQGGELSIDIAGPYTPGAPVTDRKVTESLWPRYFLAGAFVPFAEKDARERYDKEVRDRHAVGLEGPVQSETRSKNALFCQNYSNEEC